MKLVRRENKPYKLKIVENKISLDREHTDYLCSCFREETPFSLQWFLFMVMYTNSKLKIEPSWKSISNALNQYKDKLGEFHYSHLVENRKTYFFAISPSYCTIENSSLVLLRKLQPTATNNTMVILSRLWTFYENKKSSFTFSTFFRGVVVKMYSAKKRKQNPEKETKSKKKVKKQHDVLKGTWKRDPLNNGNLTHRYPSIPEHIKTFNLQNPELNHKFLEIAQFHGHSRPEKMVFKKNGSVYCVAALSYLADEYLSKFEYEKEKKKWEAETKKSKKKDDDDYEYQENPVLTTDEKTGRCTITLEDAMREFKMDMEEIKSDLDSDSE